MKKLVNTNRYELPGTNGRFIHLATINDGLREYMCFFDSQEQKCYIEETTHGKLEFIEDDNVAKDLSDFLFDKKVTDMKYGLPTPDKIE